MRKEGVFYVLTHGNYYLPARRLEEEGRNSLTISAPPSLISNFEWDYFFPNLSSDLLGGFSNIGYILQYLIILCSRLVRTEQDLKV